MRVRVGTSGFSYKAWKGAFYPEDLPDSEMLRYYSERFSSVEINNTFYRMPSRKLLAGWSEQVGDDFVFVLKASRRITHFARLAGVEEPLAYLLETTSELGAKLGPQLFQLPPNFHADADRLRSFLELLGGARAAFEFRHESWFDDEVLEALREHGAALCVADADKLAAPRAATAGWGYLRLRRDEYSDAELEDWASWVREQDWDEAFVFFKHEESAAGPELAVRFTEIFERDA